MKKVKLLHQNSLRLSQCS